MKKNTLALPADVAARLERFAWWFPSLRGTPGIRPFDVAALGAEVMLRSDASTRQRSVNYRYASLALLRCAVAHLPVDPSTAGLREICDRWDRGAAETGFDDTHRRALADLLQSPDGAALRLHHEGTAR